MQPVQAEAQAPPGQATDEEWMCTTCKWVHPMYHSECHGCGRPGPKGSGHTRPPQQPDAAQAERKVCLRGPPCREPSKAWQQLPTASQCARPCSLVLRAI